MTPCFKMQWEKKGGREGGRKRILFEKQGRDFEYRMVLDK